MSEYPHHEFASADRLLTDLEMAAAAAQASGFRCEPCGQLPHGQDVNTLRVAFRIHGVAGPCLRIYNNYVRITYDQAKRARTLADRGLDFEDTLLVFEGVTVEVEDRRKDYGERNANDREQTRLAPYLKV